MRVAVALADVARVQAGARPHAECPSSNVTRAWGVAGVVGAVLIVKGFLSLMNAP